MENSTHIISFILTDYGETGSLKYLYFIILLMLYIIIISFNVLILAVVYMERSLHRPMFFFICSLAVNGLYGSTGLFPAVLVNLLSDIHEIPRVGCFLQIFCLHSYGCCEYTNLAVMGYDRYVSICHPLHYHKIMSHSRVFKLILFTWLFSLGTFTITVMLTVQLEFCGRIIEKIVCANYSLVKLACRDMTLYNISGTLSIFFSIIPQMLLICYSYANILKICMKSSKESQAKALNTCSPHLIVLVNFLFGCLFELIQIRFNMSHVHRVVRIILSVYFLIFPPLINPIIYGIRTKAIRQTIKKMLKLNEKRSSNAVQKKDTSVCNT
ncbi:O51L1 protein, partial [Amia calva]|nr:O51L1 protein [Amia calva]